MQCDVFRRQPRGSIVVSAALLRILMAVDEGNVEVQPEAALG